MSEALQAHNESPPASSEGSVTLVQVSESISETTIVPERPGLNVFLGHNEEEEGYLRQRAPAPKQKTFSSATYTHAEQFLEVMKAYQISHQDSKAASQISKGREQVLATLLRIPEIIVEAEHAVETFYPDPTLYDKAQELYLAILGAIQGATEWLQQHPVGKQARALARGQRYNKRFKDKMQALNEALVSLQARASVLRDDAIVATQKTSKIVETVVDQIAMTGADLTRDTKMNVELLQEQTRSMRYLAENTEVQLTSVALKQDEMDVRAHVAHSTTHVKIDGVRAAINETDVKIDDIHGFQKATHRRVETLTDVQEAKDQAAKAKDQAAKAMMMAFENAEWRKRDNLNISRLKRQVKRLQLQISGLTQPDLLNILGVDAESHIEDYRRVHRACQSIEPSDSQIAQAVIAGPTFQGWVSADDSTEVFVEGGPALGFHGCLASLSLMSCLVIEHSPSLLIQFFCRRHVSSKDPIQGPQGMMRSLTCQVLRFFDQQVDLKFNFDPRDKEQLESHNLQTLCSSFATVVKQLSPDLVLICVIDSIDCFERPAWVEDCKVVIKEIQDLLYEYENGPIFKLLVTSPRRSKGVGNLFRRQKRLLLSSDGFGRNAPTAREQALSARRPKARESSTFRSLKNMMPAAIEGSSEEVSDSEGDWDSHPE
ncbi:hypothetical protein LTR84_013169 [Exophiala bonariae]|uniref:Nephrocystin 3-like N-terminal domain-containing protein n=1 Tax=Exophiala bonariae TaxID=1690606 RepID=A0AAV9NF10_9EURO|nr:hypothetical protein LTR84_013169 [Exophiala bonariae]